MLPPELQARSFRPYISTSTSFSSSSSSSSNPNNTTSLRFQSNDSNNFPSTSRSLNNPRISHSPFSYNSRVAIALLPSALFLLDLGGSTLLSVLLIGLMISYILDSLNFKPASFISIHLSLLFSQFTLFYTFFFTSSSPFPHSFPLTLLASLLCGVHTFLISVWSSLQFKFVIIENPSIVVSLERLLFATVPIASSSVFTWASISALGIDNSAYYMLTFNCLFYWIFSIPRVSSFKSKHETRYHGGEIPRETFILGPLESCIHTLYLIFAPLVFHVASHYAVVFSSAASFCDLVLLFFLPFLFQLYASTRGALWWVTRNENQVRSIRVVNGAVALVLVVVALEVRVVFHSFGRYIQVPPPLNYVLVSVTMLGGAAGGGAYAMGMVSDALSSVAFTTSAIVVSSAGAVVVGFPVLVSSLS